MSISYGWAILGVNQASQMAEWVEEDVHLTRLDAEEQMLLYADAAARDGRKDVYVVVQLVEQGGND